SKGRLLAEVLVADAKGGDALPLLQMTLQRLFEAEARRGDGVLRFADYPGMAAAGTPTAGGAGAKLGKPAPAAPPGLITAFVRDVAIDAGGAHHRAGQARRLRARRSGAPRTDRGIRRAPAVDRRRRRRRGAVAPGARGAAARGAGSGRGHQGERIAYS